VPDGFDKTAKPDEIRIDVGIPSQIEPGTVSGWDIRGVYFQHDIDADELLIGIDCFGVCGDADGDGQQGERSPALASLGGEDLLDVASAEGVALALDFDLDVGDVLPTFLPNLLVPWDVIIGVPAGQPAGAVHDPLPGQVGELSCTAADASLSQRGCLGAYNYQNTVGVAFVRRFLSPLTTDDGEQWLVGTTSSLFVDYNPSITADRPDWEWGLKRFSAIRRQFVATTPFRWSMLMQAFAGSFTDAGIGEDYVPSSTDFAEVPFVCAISVDGCYSCGGDDSNDEVCFDCAGTANGDVKVDACGLCGGNDACLDCANVPHGSNVYDQCDVCNGDGSSCATTTTMTTTTTTTIIESTAPAETSTFEASATASAEASIYETTSFEASASAPTETSSIDTSATAPADPSTFEASSTAPAETTTFGSTSNKVVDETTAAAIVAALGSQQIDNNNNNNNNNALTIALITLAVVCGIVAVAAIVGVVWRRRVANQIVDHGL
jgi:hypothetical protein